MYRTINLTKVACTLKQLKDRIEERFPESGLLAVSKEFRVIFSETAANLSIISKPNYWLRGTVASIISIAILLLYYSFHMIEFKDDGITFAQVLQVIESAVNDVILASLAIFFLVNLESKLKRKKALISLDELRAIAHIIDMHQLTKDPTEIGESNKATRSSPKRYLDAYGLRRYLDYCSELLAIVGKTAALYAQSLPDPVIISAVNEIENLTSSISRKTWQKIMILQQSSDHSAKNPIKSDG